MDMDRRQMLIGTGTVLLTSMVARAQKHEGHGSGESTLADASAHCVRRGEACLAHCLALLGSGDTSMAACAKNAAEMTALARSMLTLAASGSKRQKALAKIVGESAKDCEAECRKHADKHPVCHDCAESCMRLAAECAKS
jgi:Cys-rich four helix bundle protein (predicted Tat secretion target)